jgi:hypothetical protein
MWHCGNLKKARGGVELFKRSSALNLCQAQPVLKAKGGLQKCIIFGERLLQLNLKSLAMEAGHKFSGGPFIEKVLKPLGSNWHINFKTRFLKY